MAISMQSKRRSIIDPSHLRGLFEASDLAALVFRSLDPYTLLKVSMASRQARSLVDALCSNLFAYSTPFDLVARTYGMREQLRLEFDEARQELFCEYQLRRLAEKHRVLSHVHLEPGRFVAMATEFQVPPSHVVAKASQGSSSKEGAPPPERVDILITHWRVACFALQREHRGQKYDAVFDSLPLATVRLEALRFQVLGAQRVEIPVAIILTLSNVPVDNALTARERAVMRSCCMCMNCNQRPRVFQSMDVADKQLRVLCSTCFSQLFVKVCSLHATWKISKARMHRARHLYSVHNFVSGEHDFLKFHAVVSKEQMARALGFESWAGFLSRNHATPLPFNRVQKFGAERYGWRCLAEAHSSDLS